MAVTLARIEEVAPDQASLNAAKKLLKRPKWPALFVDAAAELLWGECQGSGATPYRMAVAVHDLGAKCSCPSRKFPCKHSIALMWWRAEQPDAFVVGEVPEWITEWLGRRRGSTQPKDDAPAKPKSVHLAAAVAHESSAESSSKSSTERKERNRKARDQSIRKGLDELDRWLADQFERGFAAFGQNAAEQCRVVSRRLADAKAGGLANRVEALPSLYFAAPDSSRNDVLLQQLGGLHLLAEAYRRQDELDPALRHDVRRMAGWTTNRAQLLAEPDVLRVSGIWCVLAVTRTHQHDRLIRCETWLAAADESCEPDHAVIVDYTPASNPAGWLAPAGRGEIVVGDLVFHPSAAPFAAILDASEQVAGDDPETAGIPGTKRPLVEALADYDGELARQPWLGERLIAARAVVRRADDDSLWLTDDSEAIATAVPICAESRAACGPLVGLGALEIRAIYDGARAVPLAANTPLGPWWNESL